MSSSFLKNDMFQLHRFALGFARLLPILLIAGIFAFDDSAVAGDWNSAFGQGVPADTTRPRRPLTPVNSASRQASKPMILPGTRLDPRFRNIPAQDPAVAKAAPAWLRAKAQGTPMYMIDGHGATAAQLRRLRQNQVGSVNVLDGPKAAKVYGPNARNGMVLITTKAGVEPKS